MNRAPRFDAATISQSVRGERFLTLVRDLGGRFRSRPGAKHVRLPCFLHAGNDANLVLTPESGLWHCVSTCGGGDVFELVERAQGLDFSGALAWLAAWSGEAPNVQNARPLRLVRPLPKVDARPFLRSLWETVADAPFSPDADAWLRSERGIEPDAAYAMGCRDWSTRIPALRALVAATSADVLEEAGFGRGASWRPLQALLAAPAAEIWGQGRATHPEHWRGLAIPAWGLDAVAPERWRWRLFRPIPGEEKQGKSRSPIGGSADLLGFGRPPRIDAPEVRVAGFGTSDTLVVVEGEPDWLSAVDALDGAATVVAVCGSRAEWSEDWPSFGDLIDAGISRVVVCVHHGKPLAPCMACGRLMGAQDVACKICKAPNDIARKDGVGHGQRFAADIAERCRLAGIACRRRLPAESYDLNDMHRADKLRGWMAETLNAAVPLKVAV